MKPKLLVVELWGLGDLVIGAPFWELAARQFDVTLLAKPYARDLQARFWPEIRVVPLTAPWTAFNHKYQLWRWPWGRLGAVLGELRRARFDVAVSARWDPRDHVLLALTGAKRRLGFSRLRSRAFLTDAPARPDPAAHHYEYWRRLGAELGLALPERAALRAGRPAPGRRVLVHSGAAQPVRVWPLERYQSLVRRLRAANFEVRVLADPNQREFWLRAGEPAVRTPATVTELLDCLGEGGAFIGNDSGPGHLAAYLGLPTLTIFGPQLPGWFAPLHPQAVWLEGKSCPYKPCSDYCRYPTPHCLTGITEEEVWGRVREFLRDNPAVRPGPG